MTSSPSRPPVRRGARRLGLPLLVALLAALGSCGLAGPGATGQGRGDNTSTAVTTPTASSSRPGSAAATANPMGCGESATAPVGKDGLADAVMRVEESGVRVAVAYVADGDVVHLGTLGRTAAWSTSKVPLAIAVVQSGLGSEQASNLSAALRLSDNDAAAALWRALGSDATASQKVTAVLRQAGDTTTTVPLTQTYAPYSIVGQTTWSVDAQARFLLAATCLEGGVNVLSELSAVDASQRWGIGGLPGAVFKGGWGPPKGGGFEVRQLGWYESPGGRVYVALAAQASTFTVATNALDTLALAMQR